MTNLPQHLLNLEGLVNVKNALFLAILLFLSSCQNKAPFYGKIDLQNQSDWKPVLYLIQPQNLNEVAANFNGKVIDSTRINEDGSFTFKKMPDAVTPILLELAVHKKGERFLNKKNNDKPQSANYVPFIWQNGMEIEATTSISSFQNSFTIKNPTPENTALLKLKNIRSAAFQKYLSKTTSKEHNPELLLEGEKAHLNFQQALIDFAKNTEHFYPAMLALRWVSPEGDFERIPEFLFNQCEKWKDKSHVWSKQLCQQANKEKLPVLIGDKLPNFSIPTQTGSDIKISKLMGNKLTILDLWASWCAPCRKENRNYLVPLWDKYHKDGFQIIGYALDGSKKSWERAIVKDGADRWHHSSHLRGDDAPLMQHLRLSTIPANIILDAKGKILAKNLHGEELMDFVNNYFSK